MPSPVLPNIDTHLTSLSSAAFDDGFDIMGVMFADDNDDVDDEALTL